MKEMKLTYKDALVSWDDMWETAYTVADYTRHLSDIAGEQGGRYEEPESSINLPVDAEIYAAVDAVAERARTTFLKYIIVVGIGGSNLGTKAVYDGIRGTLDPFFEPDRGETPKIIFADTTSPRLLGDLEVFLERSVEVPKEVLINIVSKSGTTTETIADFEVLYSFLEKHFKGDEDVKKSVVVTTDRDSALWKQAEEKGFELLAVPKNIGGRYSVFSAVGLFPLLLAGINVKEMLAGARAMRERCIQSDVAKNPALSSAVLTYLHNQRGASISNTFFFNPHLESVGRWYRQLLGESIGKKYAFGGEEVNAGITPIISIGSTDLHSMAQLYFGGPKDKFTTFVYAPEESKGIVVPHESVFPMLAQGIGGKEVEEIMGAIFEGVKEAYKKNGLPFIEASLPDTNEYALGQFLQWKMMEMMYLAHLLNINAFDQPDVEDYKRETRRILHEGR